MTGAAIGPRCIVLLRGLYQEVPHRLAPLFMTSRDALGLIQITIESKQTGDSPARTSTAGGTLARVAGCSVDSQRRPRCGSLSPTRALRKLHPLVRELAKSRPQPVPGERVHKRVPDLVQYELIACDDRWELSFPKDPDAMLQLYGERFGRTVLSTNPDDWGAAEMVARCGQHQHVERVSRGLNRGRLGGLEPGLPLDRQQAERECVLLDVWRVATAIPVPAGARHGWVGADAGAAVRGIAGGTADAQRTNPNVVSVPSSRSLPRQSLVQSLSVERRFMEPVAKGGRQHPGAPPQALGNNAVLTTKRYALS